jgi:hypothetical protein
MSPDPESPDYDPRLFHAPPPAVDEHETDEARIGRALLARISQLEAEVGRLRLRAADGGEDLAPWQSLELRGYRWLPRCVRVRIVHSVYQQLRAELAEQWERESDELVQRLDAMLSEAVASEFAELGTDVKAMLAENEFLRALLTEFEHDWKERLRDQP